MSNRRLSRRIPLRMYVNQFVRDQPHRVLATNISQHGIFLHQATVPAQPCRRRRVGLEFTLPNSTEVIWAEGEICYASQRQYVRYEGVRIRAIPRAYRDLLRDYCETAHQHRLHQLLGAIRR